MKIHFIQLAQQIYQQKMQLDLCHLVRIYVFYFEQQAESQFGINDYEYDARNFIYYIGFKTVNCNFSISKSTYDETLVIKNLDITNNYTQDIINNKEYGSYLFYKVNKIEKIKNNSYCLLNIYPYLIKSKEKYDLYTQDIFVMDKIPQKFTFNETFNFVEFLYLNVEINKDLEIEIKNPDKAAFIIII